MHLIGSEQVQSAGYTMCNAAEEMNRAASNLSHSLEMHQRFMDDWLMRFNDTIGQAIIAKVI